MSPLDPSGPAAPPDDEDPATGEPVTELAVLSDPPPSAFAERVHGRIARRVLGGQVLDYVWFAPVVVAVEFVKVVFGLLLGQERDGKERDDDR